MNGQGCGWHKSDERGQYKMAVFGAPEGKEQIVMAFVGAQVNLDMVIDGQTGAHMGFPINYCPVCGERVRMEAVHGEDVE